MKSGLTFFGLLLLFTGLRAQTRQRDTVPVLILASDTTHKYWKDGYMYADGTPFVRKVLSVREKHNTADGMIDPGGCLNCHYQDYWEHLFYLDLERKPLSDKLVIWNVANFKN